MFIPEDKAASFLGISRMQLRFILEPGLYDYQIINNVYYISGTSLNKLESDIENSKQNFKSIFKEFYDTE